MDPTAIHARCPESPPEARHAIARGVVDLWARPARGGDDDRLTQGLLGRPAVPLETRGDWVHVRLPDYEGWVERMYLAAAARATRDVLAVTALAAPLYAGAQRGGVLDEVYLGTVLPLLAPDGARWRVGLPGGRAGWVARSAGEVRPCAAPFPPRPAAHAVATARRLLGSPYQWGGGTCRGIDCSALVQLAYAVGGTTLPRDADQQWAALSVAVAREALAPGDLLFFAVEGAIVHVALALGGAEYIHALGEPPAGVCVHSLADAAPGYNARLAALYVGARRVVVPAG